MIDGILFIAFVILLILFLNSKQEISILQNQFKYFKQETEKKLKLLAKQIEQLQNVKQNDNAKPNETEQKIVSENKIQQKPQVHEAAIINNENIKEKEIHNTKIVNIEYNEALYEENSHKDQSIDFEKLFLGNVFAKIGGIALVIAICFLVKLSSQYIEFTPVLKISLGYIASLLLLGGSIYFYKKESTNVIAQILSGVSIAGLLLSTYFACFFYNMFPIPLALSIAFLIAVVSFIISDKFNSFATLSIGLFGGYLNPAVFNENISLNIMFGYLIALNLISVCYTYKNGSKNIINPINIFLTLLTLVIFSNRGDVSIAYPIILWFLYIGYDILTSVKSIKQEYKNVLRWFNFGTFLCITNQIFHFTELTNIGLTLVGAALLYTIQYFIFKDKDKEISLNSLQSAALAIFFTTFYLVKSPYMGLVWAIEGFLLTELFLKLKHNSLKYLIHTYFISSMIYLLIIYDSMFGDNSTIGITIAIYIIQSLTMLYSSYRMKNTDTTISTILKLGGYTLLYLFAVFYFNTQDSLTDSKMYINSIIAAIYSLNAYKILDKDFDSISNFLSITLFVVSAVLLILAVSNNYNNNYIPIFNIKFLSYMILTGLSIYYGKVKDEIYQYIAIVIGMFACASQIICIFNNIFPEDAIPLTVSVSLIIYAGIILTIGILKNIKSMKNTSIFIILIFITKLILFDLKEIDAIFKLIAFIIIGSILLYVSYYYQKKRKQD